MIATSKNPLLTAILKAKYFHNNSFQKASYSGSKYVFWTSVLKVKHHLHENCIYQIRKGNSNIWTDPWFDGWENIHNNLILPPASNTLPNVVSDLWNANTNTWNSSLISATFIQQTVADIIQTPKVLSNDSDVLCWKPATNGICSTKETYKFLSLQSSHSLPAHGPRS